MGLKKRGEKPPPLDGYTIGTLKKNKQTVRRNNNHNAREKNSKRKTHKHTKTTTEKRIVTNADAGRRKKKISS